MWRIIAIAALVILTACNDPGPRENADGAPCTHCECIDYTWGGGCKVWAPTEEEE